MKKILFVPFAVLAMVSCGDNPEDSKAMGPAPEGMPHPEMTQSAPQPRGHQDAGPQAMGPQAPDGQEAPSREEQIEQIKMQKIAYMTDELKLSVEESQLFWPVYNQWWEENMKLNHDQFLTMKKIDKNEDATAADLETIASFHERQAELIRKWGAEFAKVLPEEKVAKVFVTEERFKNYLIRKGPKWGGAKPK